MRHWFQLGMATVSVVLLVTNGAVSAGRTINDRGRMRASPQQMRSLAMDLLTKGLHSGSRSLLRLALADSVFFNGVVLGRETVIDSLRAIMSRFDSSNRGPARPVAQPSSAKEVGILKLYVRKAAPSGNAHLQAKNDALPSRVDGVVLQCRWSGRAPYISSISVGSVGRED